VTQIFLHNLQVKNSLHVSRSFIHVNLSLCIAISIQAFKADMMSEVNLSTFLSE